MSKYFALICVALAGTIAISARSAIAVDQPALISQPQISQDDTPVCYMQTADGRTLNLNGICGRSATDRPVISITPSTPSPNLGGLNVSRSADGSPCYGLDAQGRPCPPIQ